MHQILTQDERRAIRAYLKADGERSSRIRQIITRARKLQNSAREDVELIEKLLLAYERNPRAGRR